MAVDGQPALAADGSDKVRAKVLDGAIGAGPKRDGVLDKELHVAKVPSLQPLSQDAARLGIPPQAARVCVWPQRLRPGSQDARLPQQVAHPRRVAPLAAACALVEMLDDMAHVLLEGWASMGIAWRLKDLQAVLEAARKHRLRTQWDLGIVQVHPRPAVGVLQMGLVSRLPVKDHLAAPMPAEPLRVCVVEVFHVALEVVLAGTCLLDALLETEATGEGALLLGGCCCRSGVFGIPGRLVRKGCAGSRRRRAGVALAIVACSGREVGSDAATCRRRI